LRDDIRARNQYHRCISFIETLTMLEHISRAFIGPSLLALALGGTFSTAAAEDAGQSATGLEAGVNPLVRPGDDFFAYANGSWLQAASVPPGKKSWTARDEINERVSQQMQALLDDVWRNPQGAGARKVADFRAAYLNDRAIAAQGLRPLRPLLNHIERVHDKAALTALLGKTLRADVDPINRGQYNSAHVLGLAAESSIRGEKNYTAILVQGGLSLPGREHYLSTDAQMQALRARYRTAVSAVLAQLDPAHAASAAARAGAVIALETALAQSHAADEVSDNERNADNLWTRADFARQAPGMDWSSFFKAAGLAKQASFVAWQPSALTGLAVLVDTQPVQVWKDYLRVRAICVYADVLPASFAALAPALRGAVVGEMPVQSVQRANALTQSVMREYIGRLYVERYFPAAQKTRLNTIVANIVAAFGRRIEAAQWLSPASKTVALAKLKVLYFGMAYPEQWQDDEALVISPTNPVANLQQLADRHYRKTLNRLGKPVDNKEWVAAPQQAGGLLMFQQHAYNFTAALLQAPKFDAQASDAMAYGAIGAIVGHEVSHFVDTLGAEYDPGGRLRRWWTPEDVSGYATASEALERQFSSYRPYPEVAVDGKKTAVENVADLGGLAAAFDAYRASLKDRGREAGYVRQQDRQFFLGYARSWRSKSTEEALRTQLAKDNHAPERYRVATVRNLDAWYEAFDVRPGDRLYLDPETRLRIW
jgi:putative endopeptidase